MSTFSQRQLAAALHDAVSRASAATQNSEKITANVVTLVKGYQKFRQSMVEENGFLEASELRVIKSDVLVSKDVAVMFAAFFNGFKDLTTASFRMAERLKAIGEGDDEVAEAMEAYEDLIYGGKSSSKKTEIFPESSPATVSDERPETPEPALGKSGILGNLRGFVGGSETPTPRPEERKEGPPQQKGGETNDKKESKPSGQSQPKPKKK